MLAGEVVDYVCVLLDSVAVGADFGEDAVPEAYYVLSAVGTVPKALPMSPWITWLRAALDTVLHCKNCMSKAI